jgi:hypothetical protein
MHTRAGHCRCVEKKNLKNTRDTNSGPGWHARRVRLDSASLFPDCVHLGLHGRAAAILAVLDLPIDSASSRFCSIGSALFHSRTVTPVMQLPSAALHRLHECSVGHAVCLEHSAPAMALHNSRARTVLRCLSAHARALPRRRRRVNDAGFGSI